MDISFHVFSIFQIRTLLRYSKNEVNARARKRFMRKRMVIWREREGVNNIHKGSAPGRGSRPRYRSGNRKDKKRFHVERELSQSGEWFHK